MRTGHRKLREVPIALMLLMAIALLTPLWGQEKIPLRVRMGDISVNKVPFLIALDEGIYEKHGLDVTLVPFNAWSAGVLGIEGAQEHIDRGRSVEAEISIGGGTGIRGIANSADHSDRVILATTDHVVRWHVVAREGINSLQDLKGKRIGYSAWGGCTGYIILMLAQRMGWDPRFDIIPLGGNYGVDPLKNGRVDAFIAYEVPLAMARLAGYKPIFDLRSWNEPHVCSGVWASRAWAGNNRDTVLRFLKSLTEAIALMKKDRYVAFKAMAKWYRFTDREVQQIIYNGAVEMPRKPYPSVAGIKRAMELYDSAAMRRFKPEDFYDDSFMKELDESGFIDSLYR